MMFEYKNYADIIFQIIKANNTTLRSGCSMFITNLVNKKSIYAGAPDDFDWAAANAEYSKLTSREKDRGYAAFLKSTSKIFPQAQERFAANDMVGFFKLFGKTYTQPTIVAYDPAPQIITVEEAEPVEEIIPEYGMIDE